MYTEEENRDFLLDLYYDIKSVEDAEKRLKDLLVEVEHIKEILKINM